MSKAKFGDISTLDCSSSRRELTESWRYSVSNTWRIRWPCAINYPVARRSCLMSWPYPLSRFGQYDLAIYGQRSQHECRNLDRRWNSPFSPLHVVAARSCTVWPRLTTPMTVRKGVAKCYPLLHSLSCTYSMIQALPYTQPPTKNYYEDYHHWPDRTICHNETSSMNKNQA